MAQGRQQKAPYVQSVAYYDFSAGVHTKTPKEMIPRNAMPYAKNVLWDEKNRVSKVFGTTALLAYGNNAFCNNPIHKLYNYITQAGVENLIIQGVNKDSDPEEMKFWVIRAPTYVAGTTTVTEITPSGVTLPTDLKCYFATYKGKLYMLNGTTPLMRWDGSGDNPTTSWKEYHTSFYERFRYLCAWNPSHPRLWAAHSPQNPIRVVYSEVNGSDFGAYYGEGVDPDTLEEFVGGENWVDFPTNDGTPVTALWEFQGTLLVFKPRHIYRIFGDPSYGLTIKCVAEGLGCIAQDSIRVRNDGMIVFMAEDGIWAGGDVQIYASPEDKVVRSKMTFVKLTSEIDDYWDSYVTVPDVYGYGEQVWAGSTDFGDFSLTTSQAVTPISSKYEDKIIFSFSGSGSIAQQQTTTSNTNVVALRSYYSSTPQPANNWYAQLFYVSTNIAAGVATTDAIPYKIEVYTTKTGTIGNDHKLNCYITATSSENGFNVPDFSRVYAEGQVSGNTDIKHQDWTTITFSYWPTPQNLYNGGVWNEDLSQWVTPLCAIAIIPEGDDSSNYVNWSWAASDPYDPKSDDLANMVNADRGNPADQYDKDYSFKFYTDNFADTAVVETDGFKCTDSNFKRWRNVEVEHEDTTFADYELNTKVVKIEYDTGGSAGSASWSGSWTETENGGEISETDLWIKFKITYYCMQGMTNDRQDDSFSLMRIRITWQNQTTRTHQLIGSAFWDDRYWLACSVQDSGG